MDKENWWKETTLKWLALQIVFPIERGHLMINTVNFDNLRHNDAKKAEDQYPSGLMGKVLVIYTIVVNKGQV